MNCMCLAAPVWIFLRKRRRYQRLSDVVVSGDDDDESEEEEEGELVRVVAGEEKMEFLVDPVVLKQNPFRILMETLTEKNRGRGIECLIRNQRVIFMDVDSILIEHILWLIKNDCPSLPKLNLTDIVDFYSLDHHHHRS